jgi:hypothetical protein
MLCISRYILKSLPPFLQPLEPPKDYQSDSPLDSSISMVSDVLYCDHAPYLVDKPTDSSLVSEQVFQIGKIDIINLYFISFLSLSTYARL